MLLRRELRKACLHAFHNRADQHSACANVVKARVAKTSLLVFITEPPNIALAPKLLRRELQKHFFAVILNDKVVKDPVIFLFG